MKGITGSPLSGCPFDTQRVTLYALVALLVFVCSIPIFGQSRTIELSPSNPELSINDPGYLHDSGKTHSIQDLLDTSSVAQFRQISASEPGYVDTIKHYWIRFTVLNTDSVDREWVFNFDGWSKVYAYCRQAGGRVSEYVTGHLVPISQRNYPTGNANNILVLLKANSSSTYYVSLESLPDHVIRPTDLSFEVSSRTFRDQRDHRDRQIISIFIGIYAIMFLYNFFIYLSTREPSYVYYLLFILGLIYMTLNNAGYSVSLLGSIFDQFPRWRGSVEAIVSAFGTVVTILFTISFLRTKEYLPFWHKVLRIILLAIVVLLTGSLVNFEIFGPLIYIAMIFILITYAIVGIKSVRKKVPSAIYYLLAYGFQITGTAVLALALLGVLPVTDFTFKYSLPTGHALQILFFSFALANRINILKKSNDENQKQIIVQLKENERLQLRTTQELEEKVAERTKEVVEQKELIEAEKEKSESLLYNILPQTVAKELIETGTTKPARFEEVSILFTDFVDFTNISASIPPAKLVHELNEIFFEFDDIVKDLGLEKIKTIGDSYMAVSGLPIERDDHAVLCVRAAIAMLQCINKRNEQSAIKWNIRAGIHSGPVVAGVVGKHKFTFDLWGDTVNMASRMESNGVAGSVNLSAYTYDLVRKEIDCAYRGKIDIKGKGVIDMYYVDVK
jgi:class 3 adenylate cyclase